MSMPRVFACFSLFTLFPLLQAQTPPTAYTIKQAVPAPGNGTMTIYRSGARAVIEFDRPATPDGTPAQRTLSFYDLTAGVSYSWDPAGQPPSCNGSSFSGDWGDPYEGNKELTDAISKGDLKPAGADTLHGIPTKVYAGSVQGANLKAWLDEKSGLVIRAEYGSPGSPVMTMVDITSVSLTPPPASLFTLPAYCAPYKRPPTPAEIFAAETGDSGDNFVNANIGPGSANSCSIVLRVVSSKTMAPITRRWQAAIDTTYNQDAPTPPHYEFGVGLDGTATFAGAGLHEITNQIQNDMLRIDNPPAYFNLSTNFIQPNRGAGMTLIYRQCFASATMLYYVLKDPSDPAAGGDWLYAKAGKYAAVPSR